MRLWTFGWHDDDAPSGSYRAWFTNRAAAERHMRALDRAYAATEVGYFRDAAPELREVPTKKAELADWLTRYDP